MKKLGGQVCKSDELVLKDRIFFCPYQALWTKLGHSLLTEMDKNLEC
jgi:hypothetical protein